MFLREFLLANKKHSHFFWGQYTVHTGNRSLVSRDWQNGFSHGYWKKLIPKGKGYDPILTPGPNVSWYKSTKKILPGQRTHRTSYKLFQKVVQCEVRHSTVVRSSRSQPGAREIDPHHVRTTGTLMDRFGWKCFPKWLVLRNKMRTAMYNPVCKMHRSGVNPRPHSRLAEPLPSRLLCCYTHELLVVYNLTNSGHFTTCENEWNRRNATKLVFPSLCPLKSRSEVFKNGFQIFQFRLNFNGTKS